MFAVMPLDSPFWNWFMWLFAALLLLPAMLFAWFGWRILRWRRARAGESFASANGRSFAKVTVEAVAGTVAESWDRLREHSATLSTAILVLFALVAAWRWWSESSDHNRLTVESSSSTPSGAVEAVPVWQPGKDWPMDRGSAARLGMVEATAGTGAGSVTGPTVGPNVGPTVGPGARSPRIRWRFGRPDEAFYASAAVSGNRVFAVGSEGDSGRVVALDLATGRMAWSGGPPGMRATFASPVIAGHRLFCGEGLHRTRDARLFALALSTEPTEDGRLLWSFPTHGHIECTPTLWGAGERIYFQAGDDGIYAIASGGATGVSSRLSGGARLAFHKPGEHYRDAETALLVDGGVVYCGLGRGGEAVCLLEADSGRELDRLPTAWPVFAPPAAAGDAVYLGMGDADFANPSGRTGDGARSGGAVWRLERGTLRVAWRRELPGAVLGLAACPDGELIVGCGDGRVYAIAGDNSGLRSWSTGAALSAPLAVAGPYVYGVNHGGWLFAIDRRSSGESLVWRWRVGRPGPYVSGPVAVGAWLIVGTPMDGLVCVEPDPTTAEP